VLYRVGPSRPYNLGPSGLSPFSRDSLAAGPFALATAHFNGPKPQICLAGQWQNDTPLKQIYPRKGNKINEKPLGHVSAQEC